MTAGHTSKASFCCPSCFVYWWLMVWKVQLKKGDDSSMTGILCVSLCSNFIALVIKPSREFEKRSVIVMMIMMLFKSVPWFRQNHWCRSAPRGTQNAIPKSWTRTPKCNPLGWAPNGEAVPCCCCSFPGNQWWIPSRLSGSIQFGVIQFCYDASRWSCSYPRIESWWSRAQWPAEVEAELAKLLVKKLLS